MRPVGNGHTRPPWPSGHVFGPFRLRGDRGWEAAPLRSPAGGEGFVPPGSRRDGGYSSVSNPAYATTPTVDGVVDTGAMRPEAGRLPAAGPW